MGEAFRVKDCALITRMGGVSSAMNLREFRERLAICPPECLFHHFHETLIRATFDDPEFRNDFALWASRDLRDRVLAERLGILNPYQYEDLEQLRAAVLEVVDERLAELPHVPWVPKGREFAFLRAVTVVFDTGVELRSAQDLLQALPRLSHGSIYYHCVEARRRTPDRLDDFSTWLRDQANPPQALIDRLDRLDYYWMTLAELRRRLTELAAEFGADHAA